MADILVTTGGDTDDDNDGVLSLREAVEQAEDSPGADTIIFADNVSTVTLDGRIPIDSGNEVDIIGDRDDDGAADVTISGGGASSHFFVEEDGILRLEALILTEGSGVGADGSFFAGAGGPGGRAVGSITNYGDLTLTRTLIDETTANAGNGAPGGKGDDGDDGADGADAGGIGEKGSPGKPGKSGVNGSNGGDGGDAAGAILNARTGTLTVSDSAVGPDVIGDPGDGGRGGSGGAGGDGGDGGRGADGASLFSSSGDGGRGGVAGKGGAGGNGGDTGAGANGILNFGAVTVSTAFAVAATADNTASPGTGGTTEGNDGEPGAGGAAGNNTLGPQGSAGNSGSGADEGTPGEDGDTSPFDPKIVNIDGGTGPEDAADTVVFLYPAEAFRTAEDTIIFNVNQLGAVDDGFDAAVSVSTQGGTPVATESVMFSPNGASAQEVEIDVSSIATGGFVVTLDDVTVTSTGEDGSADVAIGTDEIVIDGKGLGQGLSVEDARFVAYTYEAGLDRDGDIDLPGLNFWIDFRENGNTELELSAQFLNSDEFQEDAEVFLGDGTDINDGNVRDPSVFSDDDYVTFLYENVLNRTRDEAGFQFWSGVLDDIQDDPNRAPEARERMLNFFSDSEENREQSQFVETLIQVTPGEWDFVA